jgi:hypothetical protein
MNQPFLDILAYRKAIHELSLKGRDVFFPWFDGGKNANDAFDRADTTFRTMMLPWALKHMNNKATGFKECKSLDIGHGSGGQVACASTIFKIAFGIDAHISNKIIENEIFSKGRTNIYLYTTDGIFFPLSANCIHFAHSWAVFMHLGCMYTVRLYLHELNRVLIHGGIAVIYFSRLLRSKQDQNIEEYKQDMLLETKNEKGYNEKQDTKVNQINLRIAMWRMEAEVNKAGLTVVDRTASHSYDKNKNLVIGGQHGIVLKKNVELPQEYKHEGGTRCLS